MTTIQLGPLAGRDRRSPRAQLRRWLFPVTYFARYGLVLWAAAFSAVGELVAMSQRGMQWRGDLVWTIDWLPVAFILVGPIVSGCAAMDAARVAPGSHHMFRNPVTHTPGFAVVVAYGVVLSVVHLLVLGVALAISQPPVGDGGAAAAVLVQLLILWLFASLGATVGRFTGVVLAGICGAMAAVALVYLFSAPSRHVSLLAIGGATVPRIGYAYNVVYLALQGLALLMGISGLLALRPVEGARLRRVARLDGLVASVLLVGVVALSTVIRIDRLVPVDATPSSCGAVSGLPVCFYPQHGRVANAFKEQLWVLVESARQKGYQDVLPGKVEEASRTVLPQAADATVAAVYVMPDHLQGMRPSLREIVLGIVQPVHCAQLQGPRPPSERYWSDVRALTATWVGLADPAEAEMVGYEGSPLSPADAATLIRQFRTCNYAHF